MVKVTPKNDELRKVLMHPTAGGFVPPPSTDPADWPDDTYTYRRAMDGDIEVVRAESGDPKPDEPAQPPAPAPQQPPAPPPAPQE